MCCAVMLLFIFALYCPVCQCCGEGQLHMCTQADIEPAREPIPAHVCLMEVKKSNDTNQEEQAGTIPDPTYSTTSRLGHRHKLQTPQPATQKQQQLSSALSLLCVQIRNRLMRSFSVWINSPAKIKREADIWMKIKKRTIAIQPRCHVRLLYKNMLKSCCKIKSCVGWRFLLSHTHRKNKQTKCVMVIGRVFNFQPQLILLHRDSLRNVFIPDDESSVLCPL